MPTIDLTPRQFFYLQAAVARDLENLEELAPWEIDDNADAHCDEMTVGREVGKLLRRVEQEQVVPF